jgi:RND family efflux transporter MFP subunit
MNGTEQAIHRVVRRRLTGALVALLAGIILAGAACHRNAPIAQVTLPPPEVDVAHPVVRSSVEWDEYTGRLAAVESVEVRARVDGYLEKIHFKAGEIVQRGDLLFTIDPRPFVAELDRADAEVKSAQAELEHAAFDVERIEALRKDHAAPEKEYRDVVYARNKAQADLERTQSAQRRAALNLEWTKVIAPITGRISREAVTVGNLVHDGSTAGTLLTTIVSLDPIHCYFDADEQSYLKYARMSHSGERTSTRDNPSPVYVALFDEKEFTHQGQMDFVDNAIDQLTGTLRSRAVLPNRDGLLIPGLFVRVRLVGSGVQPMVFVPDAAIATDQTSRMVFVVDENNVVQPRTVTVGRLQNSLRRILSGLVGTETVVVAGVQRVAPGITVKPNTVPICAEQWMPDLASAAQPASWSGPGPSRGGTQ